MKILEVTYGDMSPMRLAPHIIEPVRSLSLSPITAFAISSRLKTYQADAIVVHRTSDAMAAISALEISHHRAKIIAIVDANSEVPRSVTRDVRRGVDGWAFATERLLSLYPQELNHPAVICRVDGDVHAPAPTPGGKRAVWVGAIDGNTQRLIEAMRSVAALGPEWRLAVCGTGNAKSAMPAVKYARGLDHPEQVEWLGESFTLDSALGGASQVVQAGLDPTPVELALASAGYTLVQPSAIGRSATFQPVSAADADEAMSQFIKSIVYG